MTGVQTCALPISGDLVVGNAVWTKNEENGEWGFFPVTRVGSDYCAFRMKATFDDGQEIITSDVHKYLTHMGFIPLRDLLLGTEICTESGSKVLTRLEMVESGPIVQITIGRAHTYLIGDVISHNISAYP